jgi:hypothetical protein
VGGWWAQGKAEQGWICFVSVYENRRIKPVEIVLRRGEGRSRENNGRGKSN